MTGSNFAVTMNGRTSWELQSRPSGGVEEQLRTLLERLDGLQRFACLVWQLPEDVPFDRVNIEVESRNYIQCAGGLGGRFTCEVRKESPAGDVQHDVLGRAERPEPNPLVSIAYAEHETSVHESEVLDIDEVAELFDAYRSDGSVPNGYVRRQIFL